MEDVVIVAAGRTAVGKFGGALAKIPAAELGAHVIKHLLAKIGLDGAAVPVGIHAGMERRRLEAESVAEALQSVLGERAGVLAGLVLVQDVVELPELTLVSGAPGGVRGIA